MSRPLPKVCTVAILCLSSVAALPNPVHALPQRDTVSQAGDIGTEIPVLQSPRDHVTRSADGLRHARVYLSPVGAPGAAGWEVRDTTLAPSPQSNLLSPARVPFSLTLAQASGAPTLANLVNEDKVGLALGVAGQGATGSALANVPGQTTANTVTFPAALAMGHQDLALQATHEGLAVHFILHDLSAGASVTLTLNLDHDVSFRQDSSGAIVIERQLMGCGSTGCNTPVNQPEFVVEPPLVTEAPGALATAALNARPTLHIVSTSADSATMSATVDPAWLASPARIFPLQIAVPVDTAPSVIETTAEGTVSSCAPAQPAAAGDLVVGVANGCNYRSVLRFDMAPTVLQHAIQSATLHLYELGGATGTAVTVQAGTPPAKETFAVPLTPTTTVPISSSAIPAVAMGLPIPHPLPGDSTQPKADFTVPANPSYEPPTWTAMPPATGAVAIPTQPSTGPWQSWDVTGLVRNWISQGAAGNGGLVLSSVGEPEQFAGSRGVGETTPSLAPYLDVTFAPVTAQVSPQTIDFSGQNTTVGMAQGDFGPDTECSMFSSFACSAIDPNFFGTSKPKFMMQFNYPEDIGLSYVRGSSFPLSCNANDWQTASYWQPIYNYMQGAYNDRLIPIVTFEQNPTCPFVPSTANLNTDWAWAMELFAYNMPSMYSTALGFNPPMYFEIGNEVDNHQDSNWTYFDEWFALAAKGMQYGLSLSHPNESTYYIITGGLSAPAVNNACDTSNPAQLTEVQSAIALSGISWANPDPSNPFTYPTVSTAHLGVASHPYGYSYYGYRDDPNNFINYFNQGRGYGGICSDIDQLMVNWHDTYFPPPLRHFATEDNFSSQAVDVQGPNAANFEGAYLMDLLTWLYNNLGADGSWSFAGGERAYPFNMLWFEGWDDPSYKPGFGLLGSVPSGQSFYGVDNKIISFAPYCPSNPNIVYGTTLGNVMLNLDRAGGPGPPGEHCW